MEINNFRTIQSCGLSTLDEVVKSQKLDRSVTLTALFFDMPSQFIGHFSFMNNQNFFNPFSKTRWE
jgi:hypothetical protein